MILGRGQDVWAKLLQARAGARGPPLLVLWYTVRERARVKHSREKVVKGNPAWPREQPATASRVERQRRIGHTG